MNSAFVKRIIVPCLALLCRINAAAQTEELLQSKESSFYKEIVDSIFVLQKIKYEYISGDSSGNDNNRYYTQNYLSADNLKFKVSYRLSKRDGSRSLNKLYKNYYTLEIISGAYQSLFPFWQKYFQQNAKISKVLEDGHGNIQIYNLEKSQFVIAFTKETNGWIIKVKENIK